MPIRDRLQSLGVAHELVVRCWLGKPWFPSRSR